MEGVWNVRVNIAKREANVIYDAKVISIDEITETLARYDYPIQGQPMFLN
jgi:copper chaperone CopZ